MSKIADVAAYICAKYTFPQDLSKARLTKMVYLADWRAAILHGQQITPISWYFNDHGPYVFDVVDEVRRDPRFVIQQTVNAYGSPKEVIGLGSQPGVLDLSPNEIAAIDHVIAISKDRNFSAFVRLVYSTFPVVVSPRYSTFDLVALAEKYKAERGWFEARAG